MVGTDTLRSTSIWDRQPVPRTTRVVRVKTKKEMFFKELLLLRFVYILAYLFLKVKLDNYLLYSRFVDSSEFVPVRLCINPRGLFYTTTARPRLAERLCYIRLTVAVYGKNTSRGLASRTQIKML